MLRAICGISMVLIFSFACQGTEMFVYQEKDSPTADVTIHISRQSDYIVSGRLFGKFSENLGKNIYGGFWAQIVENPSLEPIRICLHRDWYTNHEKNYFKRYTQLEIPTESDAKHIGYYWTNWNGDGNANYALLPEAYNSSYSQLIEVKRIPIDHVGVGIRQLIFLPVNRVRQYQVSFYAKSATTPIIVVINDSVNPKKIYGILKFDTGKCADDWKQYQGVLSVNISKAMLGKPVWLCIGLTQPGKCQIDQLTLFPADAIAEGFDPEVVTLWKQAGVTLLRFPGGNYVSGYHWKDDIGPRDKRITSKNVAWNDVDQHQVGTDEHISFCRLIGAEPMICVNAGNGTAEEAADWVEYCNGSPTTRWGKVRAENGHPEPYNVKFWEIGNELWGDWQIGHCTASEYARRYRAFYTAMKSRDPSIELIACGHISGDWNEVLFQNCADILRSVSVHFLFSNTPHADAVYAYLSQIGYSHIFENVYRRIHQLGRKYQADINIAITEAMVFNFPAYQPRPETMTEAIYYAGIITSAIRTEGLVNLVTHSALINHGGGMAKENGIVYPQPVYYALKELRQVIGTRPVAVTVRCRFSSIPEWQSSWAGDTPVQFPLVDVMPLMDKNELKIILINRTPDTSVPVNFDIPQAKFKKIARYYELAGESFMARNELKYPNRVTPHIRHVKLENPEKFAMVLKPASLNVITLYNPKTLIPTSKR
ncbi:MAG: hypothetical protein N3A72_10630 [bacterium]|nr:hypothetical protein [bacterium]